MLQNYVRLSFRRLIRNLSFTVINLAGLSIGFAVFLILWPYSEAELITDQFHRDYEKIVRMSTHIKWTDDNKTWQEWTMASSLSGTAGIIKDQFKEVDAITRVIPQTEFDKSVQGSDPDVLISVPVSDGTKKYFRETGVAYADSNFFSFFSFPLVRGNAADVLKDAHTTVISETYARKYFGAAEPINKVIYLNDSLAWVVKGVFKDLPPNTHFKLDLLLSTTGAQGIDIPSFDWMGFNYAKLHTTDWKAFHQALQDRRKDIMLPENGTEPVKPSIEVHPLKDISFMNLRGNVYPVKSRQPLVLLNVMSFVILGLAWINYICLSINSLGKRMPELGIRKAVGAGQKNFVVQFLVESAMINLIAFLIALTFVQLVRSGITDAFGFYLPIVDDVSMSSIAWFALLFLIGVLTTGVYPVLTATARKPMELLGKSSRAYGPRWITGIVTLQYAAGIILLIWMTAVYAQINFVLGRDIGIDREAVIVVDCPLKQSALKDKLGTFVSELTRMAGVSNATVSVAVPGFSTSNLYVKKTAETNELALYCSGGVDNNFLSTYGITLIAGRNFTADAPADKKSVLISEAGVRRIGFASPEDALGRKLILPHSRNQVVEVIGVYKDYEVTPFLIGYREEGRGSILTYGTSLVRNFRPAKVSLKINTDNVDEVVGRIKDSFLTIFQEDTFTWSFLDDTIGQHYQVEKRARNQILIFTLIAIFIACLGLLGMISNKAMEKTKEIGIRKILGARFRHILSILLTSTLIQVLVATLIGIPVAAYMVSQYLDKFSERITLQWWHFVVPMLLLVVIMLFSVLSVLLKAVKRNPVESLRCE